MDFNVFLIGVIVLGCFGIFGLIAGVSNDAVNFLNSSIGSRVAPRRIILLIAGFGILVGVTFSGGMMEVARKGIFHPGFFTMPELIILFLAVMIADIMLLDSFSSRGLPTSTTVAIVFSLMGAAIAVSLLKITTNHSSLSLLSEYINTAKAMVIIGGIFLSVIISFVAGALVQFVVRLFFTFDYTSKIHKIGALWGGIAMTSITYFILVKGAKGSTFMTPEIVSWININWYIMLIVIFAISASILQVLLLLKINIFKPIVLIGTFALAMAFAANDLVNFIGVPLAGINAYSAALKSDSLTTSTMGALAQKVPANTGIMLIAGIIMVITIFLSRKGRTVTETEVNLGQQEEGLEHFNASAISRVLVKYFIACIDVLRVITPESIQRFIAKRLDTSLYKADLNGSNRPSFDLLRASVNLVVASVLISYATSHKLPLSTTYVTFMVAMGASFADQAWGRESAVYRVNGVLTVVGGWFLTALTAMIIAGVFAAFIFIGKGFALVALLIFCLLVIWKNHHQYSKLAKSKEKNTVFNLKKVSNVSEAVSATFHHVSLLLSEVKESLNSTLDALFRQNENQLIIEEAKTRKIHQWSNIVIANIFKSFRFLQIKGTPQEYNYLQIVMHLQKLTDSYSDIVLRAREHTSNHHKGLLESQVTELNQIKTTLFSVIEEVQNYIDSPNPNDIQKISAKVDNVQQLCRNIQSNQLVRIQSGDSKTRLSILYFSILGNAYMIANQTRQLLEIFAETFSDVKIEIKLVDEKYKIES